MAGTGPAPAPPAPASDTAGAGYVEVYSSSLYRRRRVVNRIALTLSVATMGIGLLFLFWILWTLGERGFAALRPAVFVQSTPPPGSDGGLANAIFGSLLMTGVGILVGAPIGVMAGTYLSEYGKSGWFAEVTRFINDILLSAPSIIIGLFFYTIMVKPMGHFSGWAGAMALAMIAIPIIVRTTEDILRLVPVTLREAAAALGAPRWKVIVMVAFRAARSGILTGVLLAVARMSGETAPLLFTALNHQFWSANMSSTIANLPVVIFQFAMSAYPDWQKLAWAGSLLITLSVLLLNIVARIVFRPQKAG
jgi:phosphate transport system permease protein